MYDRNASLVDTWIDAMNRHDRVLFASVLAEGVELRTPRGAFHGMAEALRWFDRPFDHVELQIESHGYVIGESWVLGSTTVRYVWRESGEVGDETAELAVWWLGDDGVTRWQSFHRRAEALAAIGLAA